MSEQPHAETPMTEESTPSESQPSDELAQALAQAQANLDGWQRARAEFANYKKRVEKEMREAEERGALEAIAHALPIMDDFARALDNIPDDLADHPWVSGTALILKKFDKLLETYAVTVIDPVGQPFNPRLHEAIGMDEASETYPSGTVTATMQKGYVSGERVLRPALVRVAS